MQTRLDSTQIDFLTYIENILLVKLTHKKRLKQSVDIERLKKYYNCVEFKARIRFHVELKKYIEERKADYEEKG